jgi:hypothetical protein
VSFAASTQSINQSIKLLPPCHLARLLIFVIFFFLLGSYNQTVSAVSLARTRFEQMGVKFIRPDDYYAEMLKDDPHMLKVSDKQSKQCAHTKSWIGRE